MTNMKPVEIKEKKSNSLFPNFLIITMRIVVLVIMTMLKLEEAVYDFQKRDTIDLDRKNSMECAYEKRE